MFKALLISFIILFATSFHVAAKPRNYDECILENIPNAQTNAAVVAVKQACRSLFPLPPPKENPFKKKKFEWELVYLDQVNVSYTGTVFEAEIINDTDYFVEELRLMYKTKPCPKPTNAAVSQVQKKLNEKKIDAGKVDGKMGEQTRSAVRAYQKAIGAKIDGKITDDILRSLDIDTNIGWLSAKRSVGIAPGQSRRVAWRLYESASHICRRVEGWVKKYE